VLLLSWAESRNAVGVEYRENPEGLPMTKRVRGVLLAAAVGAAAWGLAPVAAGAEWGSVKGRIVVENEPPKLAMIDVGAFGLKLPNETVVLGKDKELVNAVVYLRAARRASPMAVHPEYESALKKPVVLDHKGYRFVPRIVLARKGQSLEITNSDPVQYNIHIALLNLNRLVPTNGRITANVDNTSA
jgi:hypothetical protein